MTDSDYDVKEEYIVFNYNTPSNAIRRIIEMLKETLKGEFCSDIELDNSEKCWTVSCTVKFKGDKICRHLV